MSCCCPAAFNILAAHSAFLHQSVCDRLPNLSYQMLFISQCVTKANGIWPRQLASCISACKQQEGVQDYRLLPAMQIVTSLSWLMVNYPAVCQTTKSHQGACFRLTGEKPYHSVESGARHHFIIGLVIELDDKTVRMDITKGHYVQALAPLHQHVLDVLGFEEGRGPVFNYEDTDAVILHSKLAAVIDTMLSMQRAMPASRLRSCRPPHKPLSNPCQPEQLIRVDQQT